MENKTFSLKWLTALQLTLKSWFRKFSPPLRKKTDFFIRNPIFGQIKGLTWNEISKSSPSILTTPYILANGPNVANPTRRSSTILRTENPMATNSSSRPAESTKLLPQQWTGAGVTDSNLIL